MSTVGKSILSLMVLVVAICGWRFGTANEQCDRDHLAQVHQHGIDVHDAGDLYTCEMHPEVLQKAPGNCSLCGMELIKTKGKSGAHLHAGNMELF